MSGIRNLAEPANLVYIYDGSFPGFLCCVFESVYTGKLPFDILTVNAQPTLLDTKEIITDDKKAERVRVSIPAKISKRALDLTTTVFLSCLEQKELKLLTFLLRAYREGGVLCDKLGDPPSSRRFWPLSGTLAARRTV